MFFWSTWIVSEDAKKLTFYHFISILITIVKYVQCPFSHDTGQFWRKCGRTDDKKVHDITNGAKEKCLKAKNLKKNSKKKSWLPQIWFSSKCCISRTTSCMNEKWYCTLPEWIHERKLPDYITFKMKITFTFNSAALRQNCSWQKKHLHLFTKHLHTILFKTNSLKNLNSRNWLNILTVKTNLCKTACIHANKWMKVIDENIPCTRYWCR